VKLAAIVSETVLHQQVGGPGVMREQLRHIVEVASSTPNVRVQVIPYKIGVHPGQNGPFITLLFPERSVLKPIVYLENLTGAMVVRRDSDVERYEEAFTELQAMAPSPVDSLSMIKAAIEEH
jgi:hypothetical protein